ncbi:MAG: DNA-3-methyladenine glycosylase 2 family protein, partial [Acidobacteriota bacterium]
MRGLRHPDAFPASDLVLLKSSSLENPTPRTLTALANQWRPWRAYAAIYLWKQASGGGPVTGKKGCETVRL